MIRRVRFVHQGQGRTPGGSSAPKHGDLRETKGKQEKAPALSVRQGGYFCPQCGQFTKDKRAENAEMKKDLQTVKEKVEAIDKMMKDI